MNETLEMFRILQATAKPYKECQPYCAPGWYQRDENCVLYIAPQGGCFGLNYDGTWDGDLAPFCD